MARGKFLAMFYFNANDNFYKNPNGATESEKPLSFRVGADRREGVISLYLLFSRDGKEAKRIKTAFDFSKSGVDYYTVFLPPLSCGIYWYTFIAETIKGEVLLGRGKKGEAEKDCHAAWQQTVYKNGWKACEEISGKIIYQIFPDRFFKSGTPTLPPRKAYAKFKDAGQMPNYIREPNGDLDTTDFFGGNLKGIEEKLGYIKDLGAEIIYLNPIFEAHTNHRYDTSDYMTIDPILGNDEDFASLCKRASEMGIKIILDGVFSHTGNDSVYFNEYGTFDSVGAYQSKDSPYYNWYSFQEFPNKYSSWWGIKILPEVNETHPDYLKYITGKGGVLEKWLHLGASGWRLDVADELPDEFLDALYKKVKEVKPDAYVVGEVWEDATNKCGFGKRRKYLQGEQMDGVMNYVLKDALLDYLLYKDAEKVANAMNLLCENYPFPALCCLMNILGSHDTKRILSVLGGYSAGDNEYEAQAKERLSPENKSKAEKLLKLGYFILTALPGCPTVYYGDEAGTEGLRDPLNRKFFDWDNINHDLHSHYAKMGRIRRENKELQSGRYETLFAKDGILAFSRENLVAITNARDEEYEINLERDMTDLVSGKKLCAGKHTVEKYGFMLLK